MVLPIAKFSSPARVRAGRFSGFSFTVTVKTAVASFFLPPLAVTVVVPALSPVKLLPRRYTTVLSATSKVTADLSDAVALMRLVVHSSIVIASPSAKATVTFSVVPELLPLLLPPLLGLHAVRVKQSDNTIAITERKFLKLFFIFCLLIFKLIYSVFTLLISNSPRRGYYCCLSVTPRGRVFQQNLLIQICEIIAAGVLAQI